MLGGREPVQSVPQEQIKCVVRTTKKFGSKEVENNIKSHHLIKIVVSIARERMPPGISNGEFNYP